jgi:hypothetical protein
MAATTYLAAEIRRLAMQGNPELADLLAVAAQVERLERFLDKMVGDAGEDEHTLAGLIRRVSR